MTQPAALTLEDMHRKMAIDTFNFTWTLLVKKDRTPEDDESMLQAAYASRYHWGEVGTPINYERGDWQISRVYAVLGNAHEAVRYGQLCLDRCLAEKIGDFDLAYAYESLMRGWLVAGDSERAAEYEHLAREAAARIAKPGDRTWFLKELDYALVNPRICLDE